MMKEIEYTYHWKCEDKFGSILNIDLKPEEYWARMSPMVAAGPKKLYFSINRLLTLKSHLGYLVRAMRARETNFHRMFDSDDIVITKCLNPLFVMLSFSSKMNIPPELWFSLKKVVEFRRKISDAFIDLKLSQKKA